jgi:hypothetical protein
VPTNLYLFFGSGRRNGQGKDEMREELWWTANKEWAVRHTELESGVLRKDLEHY